jgi:predicted pyridoxine 5'-phosphate oxidase superfamily flavin-nucleotide-binding protein
VERTLHRISDEAELRSIIGGGPTEVVAGKIIDRLLDETRPFVEASPFVCVATARPDDRIALLFLIPGIGDTFRVNGRAIITDDASLLAGSAVGGRAPRLGLVVSVEEAYLQCPKAMIRSRLWSSDGHVDRSALPSLGAVLAATASAGFDAEEYDRERGERYARGEGLY